MGSLKPLHLAAIAASAVAFVVFSYQHPEYFTDLTVLGGILLLEMMVACLWNYRQRFFVLVMIAFAWAGLRIPLQSSWSAARWAVLAAGAATGALLWTNAPHRKLSPFHLCAFFCVCSAFASASISLFIHMAILKALSLLLLFLYCVAGARLAVLGREHQFFRGLLIGSELVVYGTAVCYLVLGKQIWGNSNALGATMGVDLFPILLWGWFTTERSPAKTRRLLAMVLCLYLLRFSMARASMIAAILIAMVFFISLREYKPIIKAVALILLVIAVSGVLSPAGLVKQLDEMKDALLYKGHKEDGVMGSRRSPWDNSVATIKANPWFGTGYGTSPTGEDIGPNSLTVHSTAETAREHGSSYMTILEWVGILEVGPFIALVVLTLRNVWRVCVWMNRTRNARHYAVPLAMVVLAGMVHASFEDWLFAVGSYLCVFCWVSAFVLADIVPYAAPAPIQAAAQPQFRPFGAPVGAVVYDR